MRQKQIIASLGALAATGLAVFLIRRKRRSTANQVNHYDAASAPAAYPKSRSKAISKKVALLYEPDDHPE